MTSVEKTVHVDVVCHEISEAVVKFHAAWYEKHRANPDEYPLSLPVENAGLWYEFFINFMLSGEI